MMAFLCQAAAAASSSSPPPGSSPVRSCCQTRRSPAPVSPPRSRRGAGGSCPPSSLASGSTPAGASAGGGGGGRQLDLDNCRALFMFYVVLFHCCNGANLIADTAQWPPGWANFFFSYTIWHERLAVPGFAFLSGLMGKGYATFVGDGSTSGSSSTPRRKSGGDGVVVGGDRDDASETTMSPHRRQEQKLHKRWTDSISSLLVGALYMQLINGLMKAIVTGDLQIPKAIFNYDNLETWYLVALFSWRHFTPILCQLVRHPLATSIALAVVHSHVKWDYSAEVRMRVFRFFPYYVAGLVLDPAVLDRISSARHATRWGALGAASTLLFVCLLPDKRSFFNIAYYDLDWSWQAHAKLFFQYIYSAIQILSVVLLVRNNTWLTKTPLFPCGQHASSTLAIYCWHWRALDLLLYGLMPFSEYTIRVFDERFTTMAYVRSCTNGAGWFRDPLHHPLTALVWLHLLSYVICAVLGSQWAWTWLRHVNDPRCDFLFVRRHHQENEPPPQKTDPAVTDSTLAFTPENKRLLPDGNDEEQGNRQHDEDSIMILTIPPSPSASSSTAPSPRRR